MGVGRSVTLLVMCAAVFLLAGCGGGSISTGAGAKALRAAGFHHMVVHLHTEIATELSGEIDEVDVGSHPGTRGWVRAELIDFHQRNSVWQFFKAPSGYAPNKVSIHRICNVIFWSYNPHDDPGVAARAHYAVKLLQADC